MLLSFWDMDPSLRSEDTKTCSFQCFFCSTLDVNLSRVRHAQGSGTEADIHSSDSAGPGPDVNSQLSVQTQTPKRATDSIKRCLSWKRRNQAVA